MENSKPSLITMSIDIHLYAWIGEVFDNPTYYQGIVYLLQYIAITRPNISFSINHDFQFIINPLQSH